MVAIGKLIQQTIGGDKEKKRNLAVAVFGAGTRHPEKAYRRLAELMKSGAGLETCRAKLQPALGVEPSLFNDAVQDTFAEQRLLERERAVQQESSRRRDFRPHIFMVGERSVPSSITCCALSGGNQNRMLFLDGDEFRNSGAEEQLEMVRGRIRQHQQDEEGNINFFGRAVAYFYRPTPEGCGIGFDTQGRMLEHSLDPASQAGESVVSIR